MGSEWPCVPGGRDSEAGIGSLALTRLEKPPCHSPPGGARGRAPALGRGGAWSRPPAPPFPPPGSGPHPTQTAPDRTSSTGRSAGASDPRGTPVQPARCSRLRAIGEWSQTAAVASARPVEPRSLIIPLPPQDPQSPPPAMFSGDPGVPSTPLRETSLSPALPPAPSSL